MFQFPSFNGRLQIGDRCLEVTANTDSGPYTAKLFDARTGDSIAQSLILPGEALPGFSDEEARNATLLADSLSAALRAFKLGMGLRAEHQKIMARKAS